MHVYMYTHVYTLNEEAHNTTKTQTHMYTR